MRILLAGASGVLLLVASLHGQGSLVPPGAPAPVLRALDQIEPRLPLGTVGAVTTTTITISSPGSYKLVGPIAVAGVNGIEINASDVDLDLGGFSITGTGSGGAPHGILIAPTSSRVVVRRGSVKGTGFVLGIAYSGSGMGVVVEDVAVADTTLVGIALGGRSAVRRCSVLGSSAGINAWEVDSSQVLGAGSVGIEGQRVSNSHAESPGGTAIRADFVIGSIGRSATGTAIVANELATHCVAHGTLAGKAAFACVVNGTNNAVHKDFCH